MPATIEPRRRHQDRAFHGSLRPERAGTAQVPITKRFTHNELPSNARRACRASAAAAALSGEGSSKRITAEGRYVWILSPGRSAPWQASHMDVDSAGFDIDVGAQTV